MAQTLMNAYSAKEWEKVIDRELEKLMASPVHYVPPSMNYDPYGDKPLSMVNIPHAHSIADYSSGSGIIGPASSGPNHTHAVSSQQAVNVAPPGRWSEQRLQMMLASRMGWDIDGMCPFRRVVPFKVTDEKISVFVVAENDAVIFEDEAKLYPSDALITQMRLLIEAL